MEPTVISDKQRREVAARIRALPDDMYTRSLKLLNDGILDLRAQDTADYYEIYYALFGVFPAENQHPNDFKELHKRLADLIELEPERTCHAITTAKPFSQTHELHVKSCSSCGYIFESEAHRRMPPYYGEMGAIRATTLPNYCQCCGAKVER